MNQSRRPPLLLDALARAAREHPLERKRLVCRRHGIGRELLRALAASGRSWAGFEVVTPRGIAHELTAEGIASEQLHHADEFDELAVLDEAIDGVLAGRGAGRLTALADGVGLRHAIGNAVQALRLGGIDAALLRRVRLRDREKRDTLVRILGAYESLLRARNYLDTADIFRRANQALATGTGAPAEARYFLLPGQSRRGLSGKLLDALVERGATVLDADPVVGLDRPAAWLSGEPAEPVAALSFLHDTTALEKADAGVGLDLFAAASIRDELREVLRRVLEAGLRWDEVEIVATDPIAYGAALDSHARRLEIPVTYAVGLPLERTRPGRAVRGYLRWIQEDFPEDVIRSLLERGDIAPPSAPAGGPWLARRLRRMQIGRGRDRYLSALERAERLAAEPPPDPDDERPPEEIEQAREAERLAVQALGEVLRPVLSATPRVPPRTGAEAVPVRPSDLARGLATFLSFVPVDAAVDTTARDRIARTLERLAKTAERPTTLEAAIAIITGKLHGRVPAPDASGAAPWVSSGGHLHLTDIEHAGYANRRATFVVGLDASRFPADGALDALLVDEDRRALTAGEAVPSVATTGERIEERRYLLAELLGRLRGRVTLSYSAWDAGESRLVPPAAEMLQALRLQRRDPTLDYEQLHEALAETATAIPRRAGRLDAADVWLGALSSDGVLRAATETVRQAFPALDRGLSANDVRADPTAFTAYHGRVDPRRSLDPRDNPSEIMSATRLETLGTCPHRYLIRYVLGIRPPDDPDLQPDRWLSPMHRGSLLHSVYERSLRTMSELDLDAEDAGFETIAMSGLAAELSYWRDRLPPPGESVYGVEADALREDVQAFVRMVRETAHEWIALERRFGRGAEPPIEIGLKGGVIRLTGAIDRIDRLPDGGVAVIDYKTGSTYDFGNRGDTYRGGRRLQHVLYAAVAHQLYGDVRRAEYHFPTRGGENHRRQYAIDELRKGLAVVDNLASLAAHGYFHPTTDPADCRFCDFKRVCRVRVEGGRVDSPLAEWAKDRSAVLGELKLIDTLRRWRG